MYRWACGHNCIYDVGLPSYSTETQIRKTIGPPCENKGFVSGSVCTIINRKSKQKNIERSTRVETQNKKLKKEAGPHVASSMASLVQGLFSFILILFYMYSLMFIISFLCCLSITINS